MRTLAFGIAFTFVSSPAFSGGASVEFLDPGAGYRFVPMAINDDGTVVGEASDSGASVVPVRFSASEQAEFLPTYEADFGERFAFVRGMNASGVVAGLSLSGPLYEANAVIWDEQGAISRIGPSGAPTQAHSINDNGLVLGGFESTVDPGLFLWSQEGGTQFLDVLPSPGTYAGGGIVGATLNNRGDVAASYYATDSEGFTEFRSVFRDANGAVHEITLPGDVAPTGVDLLADGVAVATSSTIVDINTGEILQSGRSFLWTPQSGATEFPLFDGLPITLTAHNDSQLILTTRGNISIESERDFLFDPSTGETTELTDLIRTLTGTDRYVIADINNHGQITGAAFDDESSPATGFVLTIPSPGTALPLVLLGARRRRRA